MWRRCRRRLMTCLGRPLDVFQAMNQAAFREPDLTVALHRRVLQKLFGIPLKETRHLTTADLPPTAGKPCTNNRGRAKRTVPAGGG